MQFDTVSLPVADPDALTAWYVDTFGVAAGDRRIEAGATKLKFSVAADDPASAHIAVRSRVASEPLVAWLADRLDLHLIDNEAARRFEFLDADAVYASDAAGNVIEWLCYDDCGAGGGNPAAAAFDGVTEVGLPAPEPLSLVEWLTESVGLSAWGSPSESFAWVGDREARFVVLPVGGEWYPTERAAGIEPLGATVVDDDATPGTHAHPELPYEITIVESSQ